MRILEIEWRHIGNAEKTCVRCSETGASLEEVIQSLKSECEPCGWDIRFKETHLPVEDVKNSNSIIINGRLIENILPGGAQTSESHCRSCCGFTGDDKTHCRTVEYEGTSYEAIPSSLIRRAVCEVAKCC